MQLDGRALVFALVAVALTSATMAAALQRVRQLGEQNARQGELASLRNDVASAIAYLRAAHDDRPGYGPAAVPGRLRESLGACELARSPWGLYDLLEARAVSRDGLDTVYRGRLVGADLRGAPTLTVADRGFALRATGLAEVTGAAVVPGGRIEPYVGGGRRGSRGRAHHRGRGRPAGQRLPPLAADRIDALLSLPGADVEAVREAFPSADTVILGDDLVVDARSPRRRAVYVARAAIEIAPATALASVVAIAPRVHVGEGARGSLQVFASAELIVGERLALARASALALGREAEPLALPPTSVLHGTVAHLGSALEQPNLLLPRGARVEGAVYSAGALALDGEVSGAVFAERIETRDGGEAGVNLLTTARLGPLPAGGLAPGIALPASPGERPRFASAGTF